ncbi:MAG TPA: mismatch repair protein [Acidobacteriaceae bacterium]|jgi:hypothetical protein
MAASPSWFPVDEYTRRQQLHEKQVEELEARHRLLGYLKLILVAATILAVWSWYSGFHTSPWLIALPVLLFVAAAIYHVSVLRKQANERRAIAVYTSGLARIEDRWPRTTERALPAERITPTLYAKDLDIVGPGSLFELLCMARTRMGERRLLEWLLAPASLKTIERRQNAIAELRTQLDFRETMAVSGEAASLGVDPDALTTWAQSSSSFAAPQVRWLAAGLALLALGAIAFWIAQGRIAPLVATLIIEGCLARWLKRRMSAVLNGTGEAFQNLQLVSALLSEIEKQTFETPYLRNVQEQLLARQTVASEAIAKLRALVSWKDALKNPLVLLFNLPLLYSVQLAFAVHGWREQYGAELESWLNALGEFEALLSLATYSYEHPDDPFPTFTDGPVSFNAQEMGHPLIPAASCVRNSVAIGESTRVLVISGSNMSGKSTLMRTVGINTVLALCGAPVRARQMQLTPLRIGASLLVNDSLQRGVSRFYAEIEKLQAICVLAQQPGTPVLFLLDELLQGTNSADRLVGAEGVVWELVSAGAIGILTTHDLSLTRIVDGNGELKNMHFQDSIVDGKMQFDFCLREGVVTRSNGVELMRLIGLKV